MAFIDVEGNFDRHGKVPDPAKYSGVVEFSMLIVQWLGLRVLHVFHSFVRPLGQINFFVEKNIHGLAPRFLGSMPAWQEVSENLVVRLKRFQVTAVIGVGHDIHDLISYLPGVPNLSFWDLKLPTWRERAVSPYTALHAVLWRVYTRSPYAACEDSKHAAFRPTNKYREKQAHKLFYNVHCSLKDVFYMISAVHQGVSLELIESGTEICFVAVEQELEGVRFSDKKCFKQIGKAIKEFLNVYLETPTYRRDLLHPPLLAPLFDPNISDTNKQTMLETAFNKQAHLLSRAHAHKYHTRIYKPHLVQAASVLSETNFTHITLHDSTIVDPDIVVILTQQPVFPDPLFPNVVVEQVSDVRFPAFLSRLRDIRKRYDAAHTHRIIFNDIPHTCKVGSLRRTFRKIRAIFNTTQTDLITTSWVKHKLANKLSSKYKIGVMYLQSTSGNLIEQIPHLLRAI